jgi:hypothetical protein
MPRISDDYDDYDDAFTEDYDDYEEASGPLRTVRPVRPVSVMPRSTDRSVTQAQLQTVVSQFNSRIGQNSSAIQRVSSGVAGLGRDVRRQGVAVRNTRQSVQELADVLPIFSLLQNVIGQGNRELGVLLPFLIFGGIGSSGRNSGYGLSGGGGGNNMIFLLFLITLLNDKNKIIGGG